MTATILEFKRKTEFKQLTNNISIKVEPKYLPERSNPSEDYYFFSYEVTVINKGDSPVKLMARDWTILDSNQKKRTVSGEGVIGQRPLIDPNEEFSYISFCPLETTTGKMFGKFQFKDSNGDLFWANIPLFHFKI